MRIVVVAVGKLRDARMRDVVDEYVKRTRKYARCDEVEVRDAPASSLAERITRAIPERARVVALEVEGARWSSDELARFVGRAEQDGVGALVWLVGGAEGLPPEVSRRADQQLSLSAMTLPHRLARVLLAEQIYRAFTILRGEPYPR